MDTDHVMTIYRHVWVGCDADFCDEKCEPGVTAKEVRAEAKRLGWSCAHPYGRDYCPKHASEFNQNDPQYWERIRMP